MAGWLTRKFSTILKGPYWLYWKERSEGRNAVILLIHLRRFVLENIPKDVEQRHNIDKALKEQDRVEEDAKKIVDKGFRLGFNVELNQEIALGIIRKIEKAFETARARNHGKLDAKLARIEAEFQQGLLKVLGEGEKEDREIYFKYLEPAIKIAEKSGDHKTLMADVAQLFKTKEDISRLAVMAFRWEARGVRKSVVSLEKDERKIEGLLSKAGSKKININKLAANLREAVKIITVHLRNEFRTSFVMWKRDFILTLVMLRLMDLEEAKMEDFVKRHLMPRAPELKNISDIESIKKRLAEDLHVLAQGFRRLIGEERELEGIANQDLNRAKRNA
ncbi:MAG: hypothetical protein KKC54_04655 [Nanoarchaeota archaeon]|nr:hypothetical protein [Nanoarchaeota archaeon]MBU1946232.1 hypothetical protein [Nanoarchaeota archaeon]